MYNVFKFLDANKDVFDYFKNDNLNVLSVADSLPTKFICSVIGEGVLGTLNRNCSIKNHTFVLSHILSFRT